MKKALAWAAVGLAVAVTSRPAHAQEFEATGTRALGLGGAFVAVADDASALYWNPAGLASGAYFSLLLDRNERKAIPDNDMKAASGSGTLLALNTPALGLGYYRLRTTTSTALPTGLAQQDRNFTADAVSRVDSLVTNHVGVTVLQSVASGIALGATLKLVRGTAASAVVDSDREAALDQGGGLSGTSSTRFDADVGVMAAFAGIRAGLTVRNVREPDFGPTADGAAARLKRQARAGVSIHPLGVLVAADVDLTRNEGPFGDVRNVASGAEARIVPRVFLRGGLRVNTIEDTLHGRSKVLAVGGSVAITRSTFFDAQISTGSGAGSHGWGVAGRVGF